MRVVVLLLFAGWFAVCTFVNYCYKEPYDAIFDISYGEGARHKLDVYWPREKTAAPVVVFFYGGKWEYGAKEWYRFVAATLASRGFVVVVPDYRLYPEVKYPAFVIDGANVVRWTQENISAYGGDRRRLFVMGHSAGAYIAAILALDPQWLAGSEAAQTVISPALLECRDPMISCRRGTRYRRTFRRRRSAPSLNRFPLPMGASRRRCC